MANNPIVRFWIRSSMRDFHVLVVVLSLAIYLVARLSDSSGLLSLGDILALFGIFHFFVHGYFHKQHRFLSDNMRTYSLPKKKIARNGGIFLAGFLLLAGVGMAVIRELYTGTLLAKLKAMLLYLLAKILGDIFASEGLGKGDMLVSSSDSLIGAMDQAGSEKSTAWEAVINSVQTVLIVIGLIVMLILVVTVVAAFIRRSLGGIRLTEDGEKVSVTKDAESALDRRKVRRESIFDRSPNARIRRIYRGMINAQRKRGQAMPGGMTPEEIETMVSVPGGEPYQAIHHAYEKARYSEKGCTDEDVERSKTWRE